MTDFRARGTIMGPAGLTAVFGMGTGVAPPVWSPGIRPRGGQAGAGAVRGGPVTPGRVTPGRGAVNVGASMLRAWHVPALPPRRGTRSHDRRGTRARRDDYRPVPLRRLD